MAIISFTNYKRGQSTGCMGAVMRYTMQNKKTEFEGQQLVTCINCQPESVYADFMTTKRLHHKTDGVLFYHMVQSFPKGEAVDPLTAHAAALKLAEYYEGYEVLVCTHTDREHIHSHFLINSVNFDTGKKLHIAKEQLQELRQRNDQVCMEFSLPVFKPTNRKEKTKTMSIGEYHTATRGQSKKLKLMNIINDCMYVGILRSGETRSEIFPELQIVPLDLYERAQELMEARTMHHNEVPFNSKGKALLSGMVYCAHCGSKLVLTTSSGRRAKGEPKRETHIRYACHYKIRHPQDCDGQTGYSGEKLDGIIDKIVIQLFERMKTAPRSQLIQKQREKELQLANSSVANLEKLHASAERELESYKKEIIKTINGTGSFGADILGEMIEDTRSKLAALAQELEQAKEKAADLKSSAVAVQKEYDKIMSWADLYAGSSIEGKKMILRQLIERVNIGRNFEIEVEFKISVTQFFDFLHPEGDKSVYYRAS